MGLHGIVVMSHCEVHAVLCLLKKSIIYRIPHQYSEVMELPVPEVSFSDYFVVGTI